MVRPMLLSLVVLTACFGSLSPDRSPTGLGPPDDPVPLPPGPVVPPPPPVAIATVKFTDPGTVRVGTQIQITAIARDAAGQVVSLTAENLRYFSYNSRVATVTTAGLVTAIAPGSAEIGTIVRNTSYRVMIVVTD